MTENKTMPDAQRDGKAQAAADKAYRKASRPWFKKKRFLFPLIIVALMIISGIASGGKDDSSPTVAPSADAAAPAAEQAPAAAAAAPAAAAPAPAAPEVLHVEATQLLADFKANEAAADLKYKGKTLEVTGNVGKVDTEFLDKDQYVAKLDDGSQYSFLNVNCNDLTAAQAATVTSGTTVTVRGQFQDGGDLGVEIKNCQIL